MVRSMLPVYEALLALDPAPRILVFSGDVDGMNLDTLMRRKRLPHRTALRFNCCRSYRVLR